MEQIISEIGELIDSLEADTSRKDFTKLAKKLIDLSKIYGENKQDYVRQKVAYNIQAPVIKERRRMEADKAGVKITVAQLETDTDIELSEIIRLKGEAEETVAYLEPVLKSYYEYLQSIKFQDKQNDTFTKFLPMEG